MPSVLAFTPRMKGGQRRARLITRLAEIQNEKFGGNAKAWCEAAGLSANVLSNLYRNRADFLSFKTLRALADAARVSVADLTGEPEPQLQAAPPIRVVGTVEAGVWRESPEYANDDGEVLTVPTRREFREHAYALRINGPSMNRIFPEGSFVTCVPVEVLPRELASGDYVVVRRANGAGLYEFTVKQLEYDGDQPWLWPRSDHPKFQEPIEIPPNPLEFDNDAEIKVIGFVIGTYVRMPV